MKYSMIRASRCMCVYGLTIPSECMRPMAVSVTTAWWRDCYTSYSCCGKRVRVRTWPPVARLPIFPQKRMLVINKNVYTLLKRWKTESHSARVRGNTAIWQAVGVGRIVDVWYFARSLHVANKYLFKFNRNKTLFHVLSLCEWKRNWPADADMCCTCNRARRNGAAKKNECSRCGKSLSIDATQNVGDGATKMHVGRNDQSSAYNDVRFVHDHTTPAPHATSRHRW